MNSTAKNYKMKNKKIKARKRWQIDPVTKVVPTEKIYSRAKFKREIPDETDYED